MLTKLIKGTKWLDATDLKITSRDNNTWGMTRNDSFGRWTSATGSSASETRVFRERALNNCLNGAPSTISRTDATLTKRECLRSDQQAK